MGHGLRFFFVNDDDSLRRLPVTRLNRLLNADPNERLPEYSGQKKRCAVVSLKLEGGKPYSIKNIDYIMLSFDAQGFIDKAKLWQATQLAFLSCSPMLEEQQSDNIIDGQRQFYMKRYEKEVWWTPTPDIEYAITKAIFQEISY